MSSSKIVALVPRSRVHLTRFDGVLGPHYKYRKQVVPIKKEQPQLAIAGPEADRDKPATVKRISWARLLKRVFNIDISICPKCRGQIRIIAAIEDPKIIKKILEHLGLPSTAPRPMSAREPPVSDQSDIFAQHFFEE